LQQAGRSATHNRDASARALARPGSRYQPRQVSQDGTARDQGRQDGYPIWQVALGVGLFCASVWGLVIAAVLAAL